MALNISAMAQSCTIRPPASSRSNYERLAVGQADNEGDHQQRIETRSALPKSAARANRLLAKPADDRSGIWISGMRSRLLLSEPSPEVGKEGIVAHRAGCR